MLLIGAEARAEAMTQIFLKTIELLIKNDIHHEPFDSFMIFLFIPKKSEQI